MSVLGVVAKSRAAQRARESHKVWFNRGPVIRRTLSEWVVTPACEGANWGATPGAIELLPPLAIFPSVG
eukprot:NODE_92_length_1569_cov_4.538158_g68_i0.p4 GENE.NODE_92_length_1569_cov_4.538158_g68_i0~~NODE_92_length_1569_cov_4.538158_g68_i0.p4  ORF type:complete len:69 (+),score=5.86 NODE_92_length_1569_cov_4.538158_g68_i0:410-616(+)